VSCVDEYMKDEVLMRCFGVYRWQNSFGSIQLHVLLWYLSFCIEYQPNNNWCSRSLSFYVEVK
jgi:hypothetical protein